MVSVWGREISVIARDLRPVRYVLYPGSPSATLRAPPRFPPGPVFDPVPVPPGIGNLQLAPHLPVPVEIQPVPVIFARNFDDNLNDFWEPDKLKRI